MSLVLTEVRDTVALLTMNDPRRRNPLSDGMREALVEALAAVGENRAIRAVVLMGAGGHFSSGGDLSAMPPLSRRDAEERLAHVGRLVRLVRDCGVPTVAAIDGFAAGVGVGLAAACDIVLVTERARVLLPFTRLGLLPDGASLASVAQRVGSACARRLFLRADPVTGADATRLGLADELVPSAELPARAESVARELGTRAPSSVLAIKRFYAVGDLSVEAALKAEADTQPDLYFSRDFAEGKQAFQQRREPRFGENIE